MINNTHTHTKLWALTCIIHVIHVHTVIHTLTFSSPLSRASAYLFQWSWYSLCSLETWSSVLSTWDMYTSRNVNHYKINEGKKTYDCDMKFEYSWYVKWSWLNKPHRFLEYSWCSGLCIPRTWATSSVYNNNREGRTWSRANQNLLYE